MLQQGCGDELLAKAAKGLDLGARTTTSRKGDLTAVVNHCAHEACSGISELHRAADQLMGIPGLPDVCPGISPGYMFITLEPGRLIHPLSPTSVATLTPGSVADSGLLTPELCTSRNNREATSGVRACSKDRRGVAKLHQCTEISGFDQQMRDVSRLTARRGTNKITEITNQD